MPESIFCVSQERSRVSTQSCWPQSTRDCFGEPCENYKFLLHVSLDHGLHKFFSGIRITIVALESEWTDTFQYVLENTVIRRPLDLRQSLRQRTQEREDIFRLVLIVHHTNEIRVYGADPYTASIKVLRMINPEHCAASEEPIKGSHRVLFDAKSSLLHDSDVSVLEPIESTLHLEFDGAEAFTTTHDAGGPFSERLSFRISPLSLDADQGQPVVIHKYRPTGRAVDFLPREIVTLIGRHCLPSPSKWGYLPDLAAYRESLLSFSLVRKAWKPMLEILYGASISPSSPISHPRLLARALRTQPTVRSFLTRLEMPVITDADLSNPASATIESYAEILRLAHTSITRVGMVLRMIEPLQTSLELLSSIERFHVMQTHSLYAGEASAILSLIYPIIVHWPRLKHLDLNLWEDRWTLSEGLTRELRTSTPPPFSLESLRITQGQFRSTEILWLLSNSTQSLRDLELYALEQPTESEVIEIISLVKSSVERISFQRSKVSGCLSDEVLPAPSERPIDSLITQMPKLYHLTMPSNLVTPVILSRKNPCNLLESDRYLKYPMFSSRSCCRIHIKDAGIEQDAFWSPVRVEEAMEGATWKEIYLPGVDGLENNTHISAAAKRRGSELMFQYTSIHD